MIEIPAGQSLSDGIDCGVGHIVRIGAPKDWTAAPLTFRMAVLPVYDTPPADADYLDVFHVAQATSGKWNPYEVSLSVTAGSILLMPAAFGSSLGWLKHCACKFAWLYVHPRDYKPDGIRTAHEVYVRIPGKHRNPDAAWDALQDLMITARIRPGMTLTVE